MNDKSTKKQARIPQDNSENKAFSIRHENEISALHEIFKSRLRTSRNNLGLTQKEFANKTKLSLATIRKYEHGDTFKTSNYKLKRLAEELGVSIDYLVDLKLSDDPNLDDITKRYGLNKDSLKVLETLHRNDGGTIQYGNMMFLNCFLGNGEVSQHFIELYTKLLRQKYKTSSKRQRDKITNEMNELITEYMDTVVIPSYQQIYETGSYEIKPLGEYLQEEEI